MATSLLREEPQQPALRHQNDHHNHQTRSNKKSMKRSSKRDGNNRSHPSPALRQHQHQHHSSSTSSWLRRLIHWIIIAYWFVIFYLSYQSPDLQDYYRQETLWAKPPTKAVFSAEHRTWRLEHLDDNGTNNNHHTTTTSTSSSSWQNSHGLVHVISTRFMQFQPHLKELGKARLELFRSITLPSLQKQSNNDFLWIIRTDPDLDRGILTELQRDLALVDNALLVASNDDVRDFRQTSRREINQWHDEKAILAGSSERLWAYHQAAQQRPVLETRIDADDALAVDFVHTVQSRAERLVLKQQQQQQQLIDRDGETTNTSSSSSSWHVFCAFESLEWHMFPPAMEEAGQDSCVPLQRPPIDDIPVLGDQQQPHFASGGAVCKVHQPYCFTPGLTFLYNFDTKEADFPTHQHQEIGVLIPECDGTQHTRNCLETFGASKQFTSTGILRARTPTSAGMDRVGAATATSTKRGDAAKLATATKNNAKEQSDKAWRQIEYVFGLVGSNVVACSNQLMDNLAAIVKDALEGQCSRRHSCKHSAEKKLKRILESYNKAGLHQGSE